MSKSHTAPAGQPQQGPRRGLLLVATALAAAVAVGAVLHLTGPASEHPPAAVAADEPLPEIDHADPGVVHVHGLGVDPADGVLYAATHSGLFRLPEGGEATRVANRYQDTMGFTVVGPSTFLASGHPDPREDHPPRLGLIRSSDAGQTWEPVSLRGEADFHALRAVHGNVYGYEAGSGKLMVSPDGKRWEERSQLALRDFAVSPAEAAVLLATTEQGLVRSTDGGRTWTGVPGAPPLVVLTWAASQTLYGIGPDGAVHHSGDGGRTWAARGTAGGTPEAVVLDGSGGGEVLYVAVAGRGILQSVDGGATFTTRYSDEDAP